MLAIEGVEQNVGILLLFAEWMRLHGYNHIMITGKHCLKILPENTIYFLLGLIAVLGISVLVYYSDLLDKKKPAYDGLEARSHEPVLGVHYPNQQTAAQPNNISHYAIKWNSAEGWAPPRSATFAYLLGDSPACVELTAGREENS